MPTPKLSLLTLAALWSGVALADPSAEAVLREADGPGGVLVHVGTTEGRFEADLAATGRWLVHGLAFDDDAVTAARTRLVAHGVYGLASVARWDGRQRLPYADDSVNVLVGGSQDVDDAEVRRVLVPAGVACGEDGQIWWTKPRPDAVDHWGHFDHDATGNPVSTDTVVAPVRQQQWLSAVQPTPWEGNPAGYDPGAGLRVWGRYAVTEVDDRYAAPAGVRNPETWTLQCRDAFNGVPLWSVSRPSQVARHRWALAVDDDRVYAWLKLDGELSALDVATGEVLRTYPGTSAADAVKDGETTCVRAAGKTLLVGLRDRLVCFDALTGERRWQFARDERFTLGPVLDAKRNRVYCIVARPGERRTFGGRWPSTSQAESVVALDAQTGRLVWECDEVASRELGQDRKGQAVSRGVGQLLPGDAHLVVFTSKAISGGQSPYVGAIDLDTGRLVQSDDQPFEPKYNTASYNVLWRDGAAWFAGAFTNVWRYDPASGKVERVLTDSWNQRCTRFTATPRYFLFGQAAFYERDFSGEQVCAARSGCALGNIPANGLTYFTPTMCGCITMVRGFQAMTGSEPPPEVPDAQRAVAVPTAVSRLTAPAELPDGIVAAEWTKQWRAREHETPAVRAHGLDLVAVVHQHRLEARRDGEVVWSVTADARVSSPPVVVGDVAVFGSHDGCVYGVSLPDGRLKWKRLLAPSRRLIGVNGQLESTWPVYGVAVKDGSVVASAGTHVELSGGVTVSALDPLTGRPQWTKRLQKSPSRVPAGGQGTKIAAFSFVNSVPVVEGERITLGDGGRQGGSFAFTADESTETLAERLDTPGKK